MSTFRLHCIGVSGNSYKAALMLNCSGADWQPVFVDMAAGTTRKPEWRDTLNEMGEVPVLEHDGKLITQSGVILNYIARKLGKFGAATEDEQDDILRWMLFDNHKFTGSLAPYRFLNAIAPVRGDPAVIEFFKTRFDAALAIVEKHLSRHPFLVGGRPTVADFSLSAYMLYPVKEITYVWPQTHPAVNAWLERIKALPGWVAPYDLMPMKA